MKKKMFLAIVICLFAAVHTPAQESAFVKGDNVVSLGVGFGGNLYTGYGYGRSDIDEIPTFTLSYERCIIGNLFNEQSSLGVGGLVGYTSAKYDYSGWGWTSTDIMIGARGAMHYTFVDRFDTYAGVMAGYNVNSWKWNGVTTSRTSGSSGLIYTFFVGGRYYLGNSFAVFAEVGYGYNLVNAGLSFKF